MNQTSMFDRGELSPITFSMGGITYEIVKDTSRPRLAPSWWVRRLWDGRASKRYYSHPDGAFSAVYWNRVQWEE